jgi:hypothetical protein
MKASIDEHASSTSEMFGDYPQKLKKWTMFVLYEYASDLAKVPFVSFRLDDINGCTIALPSGAAGVVVNNSFLIVAPVLLHAFLNIYDQGTSEPGVFKVGSSKETDIFLRAAKIFASNKYDELESVVQSVFDGWRSDALQRGMYLPIIAAIHECGHILLGHLKKSKKQSLSLNQATATTWDYTWDLEFEADEFAIKHLIYVDSKPDQEHLFYMAALTIVLFGFLQLIRNENPIPSATHPEPTLRWSNVRGQFVHAMGSDFILKRFEHIIQSLATVQKFKSYQPG